MIGHNTLSSAGDQTEVITAPSITTATTTSSMRTVEAFWEIKLHVGCMTFHDSKMVCRGFFRQKVCSRDSWRVSNRETVHLLLSCLNSFTRKYFFHHKISFYSGMFNFLWSKVNSFLIHHWKWLLGFFFMHYSPSIRRWLSLQVGMGYLLCC